MSDRSAPDKMERYLNLSGNAGVAAFEIQPDSIVVEFVEGGIYLYDEERPGAADVAEMQRLARAGRGLSAFISQFVRDNYARKLR